MLLSLIGDIHGEFEYYNNLIRYDDGLTIQVGDFGIGFPDHPYPKKIDGNHWFIRGNHDNPFICKDHPNYLGDYGYKEDWDLFYVSGAASIDYRDRTNGYDWWSNEELDYHILRDKVIPLYENMLPRIMVTHTCPVSILDKLLSEGKNRRAFSDVSRMTEQALQQMLEIYHPSLWVFGHHHHSFDMVIDSTRFIGLNIGQLINIELH